MYGGKEDWRPRGVQDTRGKSATESRNTPNEKEGHGKCIYFYRKFPVSLPVLVYDISSVVKGQHIEDGHGNDTVFYKNNTKSSLPPYVDDVIFYVRASQDPFFPANLKAMTMTRARMAPCMNRWLMQPRSGTEF